MGDGYDSRAFCYFEASLSLLVRCKVTRRCEAHAHVTPRALEEADVKTSKESNKTMDSSIMAGPALHFNLQQQPKRSTQSSTELTMTVSSMCIRPHTIVKAGRHPLKKAKRQTLRPQQGQGRDAAGADLHNRAVSGVGVAMVSGTAAACLV